MKILETIDIIRAASRAARKAAQRVGLVPTMGALHEGHLSLVRIAKEKSDFVAVSIFVNPLQFAPTEDLAKYPRAFEYDCEVLKQEGVDLVFAPSVSEMYPRLNLTYVNVEGLSEQLDGKSRPGHLRGVVTVVSKLFHIVEPDVAVFGQKDAAQLAVIRRMVRDQNLPVEIVAGPIVREPDGLAMSSRNVYLDAPQRSQALVLSRTLKRIEDLFRQGERSAARLLAAGREVFSGEPDVRLDYLSAVDPDTLEPVDSIERPTLVAIAAYVGTTRLIDNTVLQV